MAPLTTGHLLLALQQVCSNLSQVDRVEVQAIDSDTLSVRVYLILTAAFIHVFCNITTDKTAFALVEGDQRVFGVDNAKMGWHVHPFDNPAQHVACAPVQFDEFMSQVEAHYRKFET